MKLLRNTRSNVVFLAVSLSLTLLTGLGRAVERPAVENPQAKRPNFVFILADDQRANELGCTGDPIVRTPNIDRLARQGVLFENSFVTSASCMPNRTSLLTGQWERRHTIGWNSGSALSAAQWAATFPMALKRQGYAVGYLGKNHTPGVRPADFDYYYGSHLGHLGFYPKATHPIFRNAAADTQIEILAEGALDFLQPDAGFRERVTEDAKRLLRARPQDRPFFLYVNLNVPHAAGTRSMQQKPSDDALYRTAYRDQLNRIKPPPGYVAEKDVSAPKLPRDVYSGNQISSYDYRKSVETLREQRVRISQTVAGIDRLVGQLAARLKELGLADNTIFLYSSDNGILHGEHGYGGKVLLYEPSIRVPLIVYDPRQPQPAGGRRVRELVVSADVAPTILELGGAPPVAGMQGRSLVPLLRGKKVDWRKDFFCESLMLLQEYPISQGVRSRDWKYLRYWPNRRAPSDYRELLNLGLQGETPAYEELFDLRADPHEQKNLANDPRYADRLAALRKRSVALLREARAGDPAAPLPSISGRAWAAETAAEATILSAKAAAKEEKP